MKRWGLVVTAYYAVMVIVLFGPVVVLLHTRGDVELDCRTVVEFLSIPVLLGAEGLMQWPISPFLLSPLLLLGGQMLLLFLTVDSTRPRTTPQRSIAFTASTTALMLAILMTAAATSFFAAVPVGSPGGVLDSIADGLLDSTGLLFWVSSWVFWGAVFWLHLRGGVAPLDAALRWLIKGSVLELLIAIPSHVYTRQRNDCCAPPITSYGIVTGIAVMLACFGPGVIALYLKRIRAHTAPGTAPRGDVHAAAARLARLACRFAAVALAVSLAFVLGAWMILDRLAIAASEDMVNVRPGAFLLAGVPSGNPPAVGRRIEISRRIAVSRYPVLPASMYAFEQATCRSTSTWNPGPVLTTTRTDAEDFAHWLAARTGRRFRLPTDAEWEYLFGGTGIADRLGLKLMPNGRFEWVADCWSDDASAMPADGSAWVPIGECERFVQRGAQETRSPSAGESATRWSIDVTKGPDAGFRLVEDLD